MNVLMLSPMWRRGGLGRVVDELSFALQSKGHSTDLLVHFPGQPFHLVRKGQRTTVPTIEELISPLKAGKYDVIHAHTYTFADSRGGGLSRLLTALAPAPLVYTVHDHVAPGLVPEKDYRAIEETAAAAQQITHINGFMQRQFEMVFPQTRGKNRVITNGTEMMKYHRDPAVQHRAAELKAQYAPRGEPIILYMGRGEAKKGIYEIQEAFCALYKDRNTKHLSPKLVIHTNLKEEEKTKYLARFGSLARQVSIHEWLSTDIEIAARYSMASVALMPSWLEPAGLVALEALCMGTPCIVTNAGGPIELYIKPGYAIPCLPKDSTSLKEAMAVALTSSDVDTMTEKARVKISSEYSWNNRADTFLATYIEARRLSYLETTRTDSPYDTARGLYLVGSLEAARGELYSHRLETPANAYLFGMILTNGFPNEARWGKWHLHHAEHAQPGIGARMRRELKK